ncbi:MAG: energy transducer TonB [Myxococcota bacterium]
MAIHRPSKQRFAMFNALGVSVVVLGCAASSSDQESRSGAQRRAADCKQIENECGKTDCQVRVLLEFDIDLEGRPFDIEVVQSCPAARFDAVAVEALSAFRYQATQEIQENERTALVFPPDKFDTK